MHHQVKKLMYTVRVDAPDPKFGNMLLEQFGGANGELAAPMRYSILRRRRHQGCTPIRDEARNYSHEGFHRGAGEYGQAALRDRKIAPRGRFTSSLTTPQDTAPMREVFFDSYRTS
jgi:hypothetical protein